MWSRIKRKWGYSVALDGDPDIICCSYWSHWTALSACSELNALEMESGKAQRWQVVVPRPRKIHGRTYHEQNGGTRY